MTVDGSVKDSELVNDMLVKAWPLYRLRRLGPKSRTRASGLREQTW
jgi:hypothetical protein